MEQHKNGIILMAQKQLSNNTWVDATGATVQSYCKNSIQKRRGMQAATEPEPDE